MADDTRGFPMNDRGYVHGAHDAASKGGFPTAAGSGKSSGSSKGSSGKGSSGGKK